MFIRPKKQTFSAPECIISKEEMIILKKLLQWWNEYIEQLFVAAEEQNLQYIKE